MVVSILPDCATVYLIQIRWLEKRYSSKAAHFSAQKERSPKGYIYRRAQYGKLHTDCFNTGGYASGLDDVESPQRA